jgi:hypothetical protein
MQLKKEISIGQLVSIATSLIMIAYVYGSLHFQVANHEDRLKTLEAAQIEMTRSVTILSTIMADRDKVPQTINIK